MSQCRFAAIILAAGSGTRMKSAIPKVMHPVAGQPMIRHLLDALQPLTPAATVVVVGPQMDDVARAVAPAECALQDPPLGTGDAVRVALHALCGRFVPRGEINEALVLFGDTPLLRSETLCRLLTERRKNSAAVVVSGMRPADPGAYGRFVTDADGGLERIVEAADATPEERAIGLVNGGIMAIDAQHAGDLVDALDRDNAKGEFYLTDIVRIARKYSSDLHRVRAARQDGNAIPTLLSMPDRAVAQLPDFAFRKPLLRRAQFLEAGDIRLFLFQPAQQHR